VHEAVANPGWRTAMEVEVEMAALHQNGTWDLGIFSLVRRLWVVNEYTQPSLIQWLT